MYIIQRRGTPVKVETDRTEREITSLHKIVRATRKKTSTDIEEFDSTSKQ